MGMPMIVSSKGKRCDAVTDIIQSVALEQTAISHILNAEGEKIQKIVADKGVSVEELLAANKSAHTMVESITRLEMVLQSKLELFEDCLCEPCKKEHKTDYDV